MTRLATIGPRAVHQPLTTAIYNQLQSDTDWDYVAGAALAALTGGNTLNITSRHHKVTIVGGTIDNIADAGGIAEGQLLELYCTGATTIRNNGGGAGNIRSISGQDITVFGTDVVELVFDGTNWRECARANVNFPAAGKIVWGGSGSGDTQLGRLAAGVVGDSGSALSTGPTSGAIGQAGVFLSTTGQIFAANATGTTQTFLSSITGDSTARVSLRAQGDILWSGGSGGSDTTLVRASASVLSAGNKVVEGAVATTQAAGTTWTPSLSNGLVQRVNVTSAGTLTIGSPGAPPAGTSGFLVLIIHNTSGGTVTLSWNAIYSQAAIAPGNGTGEVSLWVWNPGTSKWEFLFNVAE